MAFVIEQRLDEAQHHYDKDGDVLYVSFGPPMPAVSVNIEDWLILRITPGGRHLCGLTIIGFKRLFEAVRPELITELPERLDRISQARFVATYADDADTLTVRFEEEQPVYYEPFVENVYLERALFGDDIIGFRVTHYTEHGTQALDRLLESILDTLFTPGAQLNTNASALTRVLLQRLDIPKLLSTAA